MSELVRQTIGPVFVILDPSALRKAMSRATWEDYGGIVKRRSVWVDIVTGDEEWWEKFEAEVAALGYALEIGRGDPNYVLVVEYGETQ